MQTETVLTRFCPEHIADAVALSTSAGWPHRAEDWALVLGLSKGIVAIQNGKVVATAIATPFGPVGTVNMIIVDETMRGRGLGRRIMTAAMSEIEPEEWRLVATRDGLALYEKLGFEIAGEVRQYQGTVSAAAPAENITDDENDGIGWATDSDPPRLADLDQTASGMNRTALVQALKDTGRVLCLRENGRIQGWAALRLFGRGEVIGPVVARDRSEARRLLHALLRACEGRYVRVDTTADTGLGSWLEGFALQYAGGGVAMRKGSPRTSTDTFQTFALASQALG